MFSTPVLPHFLSAHVARELHGIKTVEFDIGATETLDWSAYSHVMDSNRLALSFLEELFSSRASLTKICISFEKLHPMKDHPSFWSSIIISIKAAAKACTINLGASEPWTTPADDVKAITIVWKAEKGRVLSWSLGE